jgi:hypothetical protein
LVAYYPFNQGIAAGDNTSITTVTDKTANALNGTLTNFAKTGATSNFVEGKVAGAIVTNGIIVNLDAGNVASYPGTGTTWTDLSGNGNNGTLINGVGYNALNGGSLVFNGINQGVSLLGASTLSVNQMTVSSWNYSADYAQSGFMFEKTTNGQVNTQYSLFYNNNNLLYYRTVGLTPGDLTVNRITAGVLNNQWNNVVATYDGSSKKIYVNGVLKATINVTGTLVSNTTGASYIGIFGSFAGYPFNGKIAHTSVYNRALSDSEIQQNFNATKAKYGL